LNIAQKTLSTTFITANYGNEPSWFTSQWWRLKWKSKFSWNFQCTT